MPEKSAANIGFETVQKNAVFTDYLQNGIKVRFTEKGEERSTLVVVELKWP